MRRMLRLLILCFAFVLNFTDKPVLGDLARAIVGGNVTLTASKNCTGVYELITNHNTVTAARREHKGMWMPVDKRFVGRIEHDSPSSLTITNLNVKDKGLFVFVCNGDHVIPANDLKVLVAYNTTVTEGERVEFPCYSSTADEVKWSKEGGKIRDLEVIYKEDETSPGKFLLILEKVRLEDKGVYFCDAPMAFKLNVTQRSNQTTSTPPHHPSTTQSPNEGNEMGLEIIIWVLVALLFLFVIVVIVLVVLLCRKKKKGPPDPEQGLKGDETEMVLLEVRNNNTGSHVNNHGSH